MILFFLQITAYVFLSLIADDYINTQELCQIIKVLKMHAKALSFALKWQYNA